MNPDRVALSEQRLGFRQFDYLTDPRVCDVRLVRYAGGVRNSYSCVEVLDVDDRVLWSCVVPEFALLERVKEQVNAMSLAFGDDLGPVNG